MKYIHYKYEYFIENQMQRSADSPRLRAKSGKTTTSTNYRARKQSAEARIRIDDVNVGRKYPDFGQYIYRDRVDS